jgi:CRISPR-associated DxTHG motif protein
MRVVITFLGLFPKLTEYKYQGRIYKGEVFAQALREFCQFDRMLVCVTPEARDSTLPLLTELNDLRIEPVEIPKGENTSEMWETFDAISQRIQPKDEVTFDITHGLRSLPFLVFLFAAYLKAAKQVSIIAVYYGAHELGKPAPVIDLSSFVSLLDWTTATDQFIKTGNGQALANLLQHEGDSATQDLAKGIDAISEGLHLLRPMTVLHQSAQLPNLIQAALFAALLERVQNDYTAFGLEDPTDYKLNAQAALVCQLKMIEWYADKEQIVQALSMAREWLPSLLCYHFNLDPLIDKPNRDEMELLLKGGKDKTRTSQYLSEWESIPNKKRKLVATLWGGKLALANLRNDVLHSGFRKNPGNPKDILKKTRQVVVELKKIAVDWGI